MKDLIKKINLNKCLLFVYAFIFCVLLFFNQYWITNPADDTHDIGNYTYIYHGKYIVSYLLNISYSLVLLFFDKIHINTWGQTGGAVLYSIFVIMLMSTLASLFFIKNKKNFLYPLIILINFIIFYYVFSMGHFEYYYYMYSKTFFFYCILGYIFLFLFMKKMLTVLLNEIKSNKKDIFELSLYAVLMGFSGDIISAFTLLFLFVLLCFKAKLKNITIGKILIIVSFLFLSLYISSLNFSFQISFSLKKIFETLLLGFDNFIEILKELTVTFIDIFKQEFCILFLIVLFLSVLIYCVQRKTDKSYNFFNFILILTFILYFHFFFFVGLGYLNTDNYIGVLMHRDIWFQSKLFLLMLINIQAGFLLNEVKNNKKLLIIIAVFLACLSYKYLITEIKLINDVGIKNYVKEKIHIEQIKEDLKNRYMLECIFLWYLYNDKCPVIIKKANYFYLYLEINENASDEFIHYVSMYYYFQKYFNYKKYDLRDIRYLDTLDEVIEKYYENGGREISETEINEANFNKLLDKNWVLYGK